MKRTTAFLIPLQGLIVRDPISKDILSATGEVKPLIGPEGRYWRRRLRDGSVIIRPEAKPEPALKRKQKTDE